MTSCAYFDTLRCAGTAVDRRMSVSEVCSLEVLMADLLTGLACPSAAMLRLWSQACKLRLSFSNLTLS